MKAFLVLISGLFVMGTWSVAEQTVTEKAASSARDAKRELKKKAHRIEEKFCAESDEECLAEKAKHRARESKEYMMDKAKETKENID